MNRIVVLASCVLFSANVVSAQSEMAGPKGPALRTEPDRATVRRAGPFGPAVGPGPAASQIGPAASQTGPVETLPLTLEEAVRRAIDNNPELAIVRLGTLAEVARVAESETAYTPVFSTLVGSSGDVTPPSNFLLGDRGVDTNDLFTSTGVSQRLPRGGGSWSVSWDTSRTKTNSPLTSFDPSLQSGFQVAFSQPLLKDFRLDRARYQKVIARRNLESSELRARESAVQTTAAVKQAYWTLKAAIANVTVQQRSLELAQELVRQNKARVDVGQTAPLDLLQAEAEVAQRRENLILANAAAGDAEDRLRRLIMNPTEPSFWRTQLNPTDEPIIGGPLPDVDAVAASAFNERYDIQRARKDLDNIVTNVEFLRDQRLPDVRLETSYRGSGLGGTQFVRTGPFPGIITSTLNRSYSDVLGQVFGRTYPTWSAGLTVSYSLGRSYEEAGLARTEIERRQAAQRISSLQLQVAETIRQAARQVHSTAERIETARAGAALNEQRVNTEQRRYEVGLSTSFLVTQAQRDLLQAQVNLLQATLDHQSALVNFEALQQAPALAGGQSLDVRGQTIAPLPAPAPRGLFRPGSGTGF